MTSQMEVLADLFDAVESNMDTVCSFAANIQAPQDLLSNLDNVKKSIIKCKKSIVLHLNHGLPVNISNLEVNQQCKMELTENKVKSEEKTEHMEISDMLESSEILFEIENENKRDNNLSKLMKRNQKFLKNEISNPDVTKNYKDEKNVDIETKIESEPFDNTDDHVDLDDNVEVSEDEEGDYSGLTELCRICERPAPSHKNYGAISCFSCRAFFRRSGQKDYRCVLRTGECEAKGGRISCQLCRYNKCLQVGMNPDLVDKQKAKKQKDPEKGNAALTEICRVCGNPASKYLNFGVICCGSCRIFFMRHCHRQLSCVDGTDNCQPDQNGKIKCQSCRIKKCIKSGMSPDSVGHKQKHKVIVNNSVKSKINSNENVNSEILRQPEEALINYLNLTKINHKFTHEEVWSALEKCEYEYFIIGKEKDDEIVKQCGICSHRGSGELTEHIQSHFQLVSCKDCHLQLFEFERSYHQKMTHFIKCRFCSVRLKTVENHEEKCLLRPVSGLSCKICGKTKDSQQNLRRHMRRIHLTDKPEISHHPCHVCGRIFKHQEAVKNHHRNVHAFTATCDICGAKHKNKYHLLKHKFVAHSVDLRECCDKCGANVFDLSKHRNSRHQNGQNACKLCEKSYKSRESLRIHVKRVHEKSSACKCEICGKQFSTIGVLPRHMKNVHKIEVSFKELNEKFKSQNENC